MKKSKYSLILIFKIIFINIILKAKGNKLFKKYN